MARFGSFLKRLALAAGLAAAGCGALPFLPTPVPPTATAVPFAPLSAASVAGLTKLASVTAAAGTTPACSAQSNVMTIVDQHTITVYQLSSLTPTQSIHSDTAYQLAAVSPDGQRVAAADPAEIQVWDAASGKTLRFVRLYVTSGGVPQEIGMYTINLAYGPRHWVVVGAAGKAYDLAGDTGAVNHIFGGDRSTGSIAAYTADGQLVALANADKATISFWRTADGGLTSQVSSPGNDWLTGMAISNDASTVAASDDTHGIYVWDMHTWQAKTTLPELALKGLAMNADGSVVFGWQGSQVSAWEVSTGQRLASLPSTGGDVKTVQTCAAGRLLMIGSQSGTVDVYGVKS